MVSPRPAIAIDAAATIYCSPSALSLTLYAFHFFPITVNPEPVYSRQSQYQQIDVYDSESFGKVLVLDNSLQITERDAMGYNEMLTHIPMFSHEGKVNNVLVIGGGDSYAVSEVLKHKSVEKVIHAELDREVIETSARFFDWANKSKNDSRVEIKITDGATYLESVAPGSFDVIIQDSSDPVVVMQDGRVEPLPSGTLYTKKHFENVRRALTPSGIYGFQAESFLVAEYAPIIKRNNRDLKEIFEDVTYAVIPTPTYPPGQIGFHICHARQKNKNNNDDEDVKIISMHSTLKKRFQKANIHTEYYTPALHISALLGLPKFGKRIIQGGDEEA